MPAACWSKDGLRGFGFHVLTFLGWAGYPHPGVLGKEAAKY